MARLRILTLPSIPALPVSKPRFALIVDRVDTAPVLQGTRAVHPDEAWTDFGERCGAVATFVSRDSVELEGDPPDALVSLAQWLPKTETTETDDDACTCGDRRPGVVHTDDGPCYLETDGPYRSTESGDLAREIVDRYEAGRAEDGGE